MSASRRDHDDQVESIPLTRNSGEEASHLAEQERDSVRPTASRSFRGSKKPDKNTTQPASSSKVREIRIEVPKSFLKILLRGLVRCIISWVLIAGFYISLWEYKDRVLSPRTKSVFDAITVALSIAFGLNIASALKEIALNLRWWILARRRRPVQEVELILHCDSMTDLLKLMFSVPKPSTIGASLAWLSINMLAQTGIAILGLTYSATPGSEDIYRASTRSSVAIPDFSHFTPDTGRPIDNYIAEEFAAHVLGDIGSSYNYSMLPKEGLAGTPWASNPAAFWNATDHWEYACLDSAPSHVNAGPGFLSIYTNSVVKSSGICTTPPYRLNYTAGVAAIEYLDTDETVLFPANALGGEGTYYQTSIEEQDLCGPGCSNVKIIETASGPPAPGSFVGSEAIFYYDCNVTVSSSADLANFTGSGLFANNSALAARAIALSGQIPQAGLGSSNFVFYDLGVLFGAAQNNSVTGMANQLSRFAIGVIAAAAQTNRQKIVSGYPPAQGVRLTLDSPVTFDVILCLIGGVQLALVLVAAVLCSRVVIPEEVLMSQEEEIRKKFVLTI